MIWILFLGISLVTIACLFVLIYFFNYQSQGIRRIKELETIKEEYASTLKTEKTLIVGGSDVLYSFNTDALNFELDMPSVNYGTNVGLGLGFLLDFAKKKAKRGDRIVACLAYSLYFNPPYHIFAFEYYRMYKRRELSKFTFWQSCYYFFGNVKLNFGYKQKEFHIGRSGCYLDVHGMNFSEAKNKPLQFPTKFEKTKAIGYLEEFKKYCQLNNIDLWITYPSTLTFSEYSEISYLEELEAYLTDNYQVIGNPSRYFVPIEAIFNSVYHVNERGQKLRTKEMIKEINSIIKGDFKNV